MWQVPGWHKQCAPQFSVVNGNGFYAWCEKKALQPGRSQRLSVGFRREVNVYWSEVIALGSQGDFSAVGQGHRPDQSFVIGCLIGSRDGGCFREVQAPVMV